MIHRDSREQPHQTPKAQKALTHNALLGDNRGGVQAWVCWKEGPQVRKRVQNKWTHSPNWTGQGELGSGWGGSGDRRSFTPPLHPFNIVIKSIT